MLRFRSHLSIWKFALARTDVPEHAVGLILTERRSFNAVKLPRFLQDRCGAGTQVHSFTALGDDQLHQVLDVVTHVS